MTATEHRREILLPCRITDEEALAKANELAERTTKIERLKDDKKKAGAQFTAAIRDEEGLVRGLSKAIANRSEERQVEVEFRPDLEKWEIVCVRLDTEEEVDRRAMNHEERQRHGQTELPLDEGIGSDPEDAYADGEDGGDDAAEAQAEQDALDAEDKPRTRVRKGKAAPVEETVEPAEAH